MTRRLVLTIDDKEQRQIHELVKVNGTTRDEVIRRAIRDLWERHHRVENAQKDQTKRRRAVIALDGWAKRLAGERSWEPSRIVREYRDRDRLSTVGHKASESGKVYGKSVLQVKRRRKP